jgi:hypothetical protein
MPNNVVIRFHSSSNFFVVESLPIQLHYLSFKNKSPLFGERWPENKAGRASGQAGR